MKGNGNGVFIGRWHFTKPDLSPNKEGKTVLISMHSFGPLEVSECGLDENQKPYALYKWLENDFYADDNYCKPISKDELLGQIENVISLFEKNGLCEWIDLYKAIVDRLNQSK